MKKLWGTSLIVCLITVESFTQEQKTIYGNCVNGFGVAKPIETIAYIGELKDSAYNGCGIYIITTTDTWYYGIYKNGQLLESISKSDTEDYLTKKYGKKIFYKALNNSDLKYDKVGNKNNKAGFQKIKDIILKYKI